jgi:hypothetical protein
MELQQFMVGCMASTQSSFERDSIFYDQALIDHYAMSCDHLETNGLVEIVTMQTTKKLGEVIICIFY